MNDVGDALRLQRALAAFFATLLLVLAAAAAPASAAKSTPTDIYLTLEGAVSVSGAATARLPVRYKGELLADADGVPLMRGGRAKFYDGRFDLNLFGVVADTCLSSNSLRPVFTAAAGKPAGGLLRVVKRRTLVMDLDAYVAPELVGLRLPGGRPSAG